MTTHHRYTLAAAITATLLFRVSACAADDFSERFVAAHNVWRSKVGVAPLKWSGELAAFAQSWANHLKKTNACDMQHRSGGERNLNGKVTGENLAWTWQDPKPEKGFIYTPEEAVDAWGNEVKYYDLATGKCKGGVCGHYTQLGGTTPPMSAAGAPHVAMQKCGCATICRPEISSAGSLIRNGYNLSVYFFQTN